MCYACLTHVIWIHYDLRTEKELQLRYAMLPFLTYTALQAQSIASNLTLYPPYGGLV